MTDISHHHVHHHLDASTTAEPTRPTLQATQIAATTMDDRRTAIDGMFHGDLEGRWWIRLPKQHLQVHVVVDEVLLPETTTENLQMTD